MIRTVDITGNWHESSGHLPHVQTAEPPLFASDTGYSYSHGGRKASPTSKASRAGRWTCAFRQELSLSAGRYTVKLEYEPRLDRRAGQAVGDAYESFNGLSADGEPLLLTFLPTDSGSYVAATDFDVPQGRTATDLELTLPSTRVMRTWLS